MGVLAEIGLEILRLINRLTRRPSKEIGRVVKIYDAMHKIIEQSDVQRVLVCKAHNGGGLIKPNTPLYMSAIYEDYTTPFSSVRDTYQKIVADEAYIRTLLNLSMIKTIKTKTKDLKACLQKEIYEGEGIQYAELYFLGQDKRNLYFCSCASAWEDGWNGDKVQELAISMAVNTIKNNIK